MRYISVRAHQRQFLDAQRSDVSLAAYIPINGGCLAEDRVGGGWHFSCEMSSKMDHDLATTSAIALRFSFIHAMQPHQSDSRSRQPLDGFVPSLWRPGGVRYVRTPPARTAYHRTTIVAWRGCVITVIRTLLCEGVYIRDGHSCRGEQERGCIYIMKKPHHHHPHPWMALGPLRSLSFFPFFSFFSFLVFFYLHILFSRV